MWNFAKRDQSKILFVALRGICLQRLATPHVVPLSRNRKAKLTVSFWRLLWKPTLLRYIYGTNVRSLLPGSPCSQHSRKKPVGKHDFRQHGSAFQAKQKYMDKSWKVTLQILTMATCYYGDHNGLAMSNGGAPEHIWQDREKFSAQIFHLCSTIGTLLRFLPQGISG